MYNKRKIGQYLTNETFSSRLTVCCKFSKLNEPVIIKRKGVIFSNSAVSACNFWTKRRGTLVTKPSRRPINIVEGTLTRSIYNDNGDITNSPTSLKRALHKQSIKQACPIKYINNLTDINVLPRKKFVVKYENICWKRLGGLHLLRLGAVCLCVPRTVYTCQSGVEKVIKTKISLLLPKAASHFMESVHTNTLSLSCSLNRFNWDWLYIKCPY